MPPGKTRLKPRCSLPLEYGPGLAPRDLAALEEAARGYGLSLAQLELLGQDVEAARAFVRAHVEGRAASYLDHVDWQGLEDRLYTQPRN